MTKVINRWGDRMLAVLLANDVAGACVPEHGQQCQGCRQTTDCRCEPNSGELQCRWATKKFNCNGLCTNFRSWCHNGNYVGTGTFPSYC